MMTKQTVWQTTRYEIDLTHPKFIGIVNVTPDSFSDGGHHASTSQAIAHAEKLIKEGADILDIGAESTRPGTPQVPLDEEVQRLQPVLKEVLKLNMPISVDTYKPEVMQMALDMGVDIINDIWGARMPNAIHVLSQHKKCGICLMHMHGEPQTMQLQPMEGHITKPVYQFLQTQSNLLCNAGIEHDRIVWDYGIGFGKTVTQNFELLAQQSVLLSSGFALLAGWSRKSSLGAVTGRDVQERMPASVAVAILAAEKGARIIRVHDVAQTVDAIQVWKAMSTASQINEL